MTVSVPSGGKCFKQPAYGYRSEADANVVKDNLNNAFVDVCFTLKKFELRQENATMAFVERGIDSERVLTKVANQVESWLDLRIFVVANPTDPRGNGVNGYASGGAASFCSNRLKWDCLQMYDGVVVQAALFTKSTTVHEVGHWLGLRHTFHPDCATGAEGDFVDDTPGEPEGQKDAERKTKTSVTFVCPNVLTLKTCTKADPLPKLGRTDAPAPVWNIMEYNGCRGEFITAGQVERILSKLKIRATLSKDSPFPETKP
jgi:hypothetical protein